MFGFSKCLPKNERHRCVQLAIAFMLVMAVVSYDTSSDVITNQFHVKLSKRHSDEEAFDLAKRLGFHMERRHLERPDEFVFINHGLPRVHHERSKMHEDRLVAHPHVQYARQAEGYPRLKRGYKRTAKRTASGVDKKGAPQLEKTSSTRKLAEEFRKQVSDPNDPIFKKEWYIRNTGQAGGVPGLDLNVEAAWAQGITGKGITTAIMDDGIDYMHPDLRDNFDWASSYDFSSNDPYPYPRYTDDWFNSHGTRCAGEISAKIDNKVCGAGVAFNSKVAGLRMLDQPYMTDLIEANSMSHAKDRIQIYSASWGPTDNGKTLDGPRNQTLQALADGINKGRKGLGSIYVWASGDGGSFDDCNCDGYAASMWTISINSATNNGETATYDESCSSTLASTFSNGKISRSEDAGVGTVDLYGGCTLKHSGTSAAAPEAAGVFALALEANPQLTWRDLQHIIVLTSKRNHLHDPTGLHKWTLNGAGLEFNHLFGYGVLDAGDLVRVAKQWKPIPERFHCVAGTLKKPRIYSANNVAVVEFDTDSCADLPRNRVNFLEHVQIFVTTKASRRGDITMFLTSPMGTTSMILGRRPLDDDGKMGFVKWPFMTTQNWAENPRGKWKLTVALKTRDPTAHGLLKYAKLVLHGTQAELYSNQPNELNGFIKKLDTVKKIHKSKRFFSNESTK